MSGKRALYRKLWGSWALVQGHPASAFTTISETLKPLCAGHKSIGRLCAKPRLYALLGLHPKWSVTTVITSWVLYDLGSIEKWFENIARKLDSRGTWPNM